MTFDDETLMAFVDGELDAVMAGRVARALADDPAIAAAVARHRALRMRLDDAFGGMLAAPPPERLTAMVGACVAPLPVHPRRRFYWKEAMALAATLVAGVVGGRQWQDGPVGATPSGIVAQGGLARALDTELAATTGETRILASFRDRGGGLCRIFMASAIDGVACRDHDRWALRRTQAPERAIGTPAYRQAGSPDAALLASAQNMMAGEPLDREAERAARDRGWR